MIRTVKRSRHSQSRARTGAAGARSRSAALVMLALATSAGAQSRLSIGITHAANQGTDALEPDHAAGAVHATRAWNNVYERDLNDTYLELTSVLVYDMTSGDSFISNSTTYNIDPLLGRGWLEGIVSGGTVSDPTSGDDRMMSAGAGVEHGGYMTIANLPPSFADTGYDIYIYMTPTPAFDTPFYDGLYHFVLDLGNDLGGSPTGPTLDRYAWMHDEEFSVRADYIDGSSASRDLAGSANYVAYYSVGRGEDSFTVFFDNLEGGYARNLISGIQIVQVPGPASLALLGIASSLTVAPRRSRQSR